VEVWFSISEIVHSLEENGRVWFSFSGKELPVSEEACS